MLNYDQSRFLDIVQVRFGRSRSSLIGSMQVQRPLVAHLLSQFDEQFNRMASNCLEHDLTALVQYQKTTRACVDDLDEHIERLVKTDRQIEECCSRLLAELDAFDRVLVNLSEQTESLERIFHQLETTENLLDLRLKLQVIAHGLSDASRRHLEQLNETVEQFTTDNNRHENPQLNNTLLNINNRYRVLTQDIHRFLERLDERLQMERTSSANTYTNLIENMRVKLTRVAKDSRLSIEAKQRLLKVNGGDDRWHSSLLFSVGHSQFVESRPRRCSSSRGTSDSGAKQ